jgi:chemotaxis protein histidine kinase CheA
VSQGDDETVVDGDADTTATTTDGGDATTTDGTDEGEHKETAAEKRERQKEEMAKKREEHKAEKEKEREEREMAKEEKKEEHDKEKAGGDAATTDGGDGSTTDGSTTDGDGTEMSKAEEKKEKAEEKKEERKEHQEEIEKEKEEKKEEQEKEKEEKKEELEEEKEKHKEEIEEKKEERKEEMEEKKKEREEKHNQGGKNHHNRHNKKDEEEEEVVEIKDCVLQTVETPSDNSAFDMNLHYHTDYTRSVQVTIGDDETPFHLLPDTAMSQIIVLREGCSGCYSLGDNHKFSPFCEDPRVNTTITTPIQWFYQIHVYETNVTGKHFQEKFCIPNQGPEDRCGSLMVVSSEKHQPRALFLRGNGFFGLGIDETVVNGQSMKMGALDQLFEAGIISEKKFGIDVKFNNHTEYSADYQPTTIRFGDYDQSAFDSSHEIMFMDTVSTDSWELPV